MEINYNIKYAIDAHKDFVPILCIIGDGKWETLKKWMFISSNYLQNMQLDVPFTFKNGKTFIIHSKIKLLHSAN